MAQRCATEKWTDKFNLCIKSSWPNKTTALAQALTLHRCERAPTKKGPLTEKENKLSRAFYNFKLLPKKGKKNTSEE